MNKTADKIKRALPSLVLLAIVAILAGLSFLPAIRGGGTTAVAFNEGMDGEAMSVLGACKAYIATHDFTTEISGTVRAKVFGIPYTQNISGARIVNGDCFSETEESVSALVKAGIKKRCEDGKYFVSRADYKKKKFVYGPAVEYGKNDYISLYGSPSVGLVKYDTENSIVSAKKTGENTYSFVLEPRRATAHSRNEIRSLLGGDSYPEYESVEFTLVYDGSRPVKVTARERFRIDKFGGTHCSAELTEIFNCS